jgi:hypothetical protein
MSTSSTAAATRTPGRSRMRCPCISRTCTTSMRCSTHWPGTSSTVSWISSASTRRMPPTQSACGRGERDSTSRSAQRRYITSRCAGSRSPNRLPGTTPFSRTRAPRSPPRTSSVRLMKRRSSPRPLSARRIPTTMPARRCQATGPPGNDWCAATRSLSQVTGRISGRSRTRATLPWDWSGWWPIIRRLARIST